MKQQIFILLGVFAFWLTSCQQEDVDLQTDIIPTEEGVPVNISFSVLEGMQTGEELQPMDSEIKTRADQGTIKGLISNEIKVIIAKKINGQWILADLIDYKIDKNDNWNQTTHYIKDTSVYDPINLVLTPGDYSATIITGSRSLTWNGTLKKGTYLNEGASAQWACTYNLSSMYLNIGWPSLNEEVFAGQKEFEVKKTDDLHSNPFPNVVNITLDRKVAKLRFLLRKRTSPDPGTNADQTIPERIHWTPDNTMDFLSSYQNGITAEIKLKDPNQKFCAGLDIWAKPHYNYYRDPKFAHTLRLGVYTWRSFELGNDGERYMLGMTHGTSQSSQYFFTEPGVELPLVVSDVRVTAYSGGPVYDYDGEVEGISIKHNEISGLVFESGNWQWEVAIYDNGGVWHEGHRELLLVKDAMGDPVMSEDKFDNYYELREP